MVMNSVGGEAREVYRLGSMLGAWERSAPVSPGYLKRQPNVPTST